MQPQEMTKLCRRIRHSDTRAFKLLFESQQEPLYRFLVLKVGDMEAAEDLLQEVFVRIWENRQNLKADRSLKSYLFTIARNLALNYLRHGRIVQQYQNRFGSTTATASSPLEELELSEFHNRVMSAIDRLPAQSKRAFLLSRIDNLSYQEIANQLELSVKTVESHIGRALKTLRSELFQPVI